MMHDTGYISMFRNGNLKCFEVKISDDCTASYNGEPLQVNGENLKVASLTNVQMS